VAIFTQIWWLVLPFALRSAGDKRMIENALIERLKFALHVRIQQLRAREFLDLNPSLKFYMQWFKDFMTEGEE
jgi:hypothetical protein